VTIDTSATPVPPARDRLIASRLHTLIVIAVIIGWAIISKVMADRLGTRPANRVTSYLIALGWEWLMFVVVVGGVRQARVALSTVIGPPWRSSRELLTDIGIAAGFWVPAAVVLQLLGSLLRIGNAAAVQAMLPRGVLEISLWIVLSLSAGICEETIFRGYLQRQFIVLSRSSLTGILLAAIIFGIGHAYQGWRNAILDGLYGAMFGALAYWRRSVRPGMIAHAWNDAFMGILAASMLHP
jgi:membrane protease YdiL (CAAX protease family)